MLKNGVASLLVFFPLGRFILFTSINVTLRLPSEKIYDASLEYFTELALKV